MKVRYGKEMANHSGSESCGAEALTGEPGRPAIEPRDQESGMPTLLIEAEGHTANGGNRKLCSDPAQSTARFGPLHARRSGDIDLAPTE